MEFKFAVNDVFKQPIVRLGNNLVPPGFTGDRRAFWDVVGKVTEVVNAMGEASASAQGLTKPITTAERLRNSEHTVFLLIDKDAGNRRGAVTGMLKIGKKGLYVFDRNGQHYQVSPPCVLDFYVHESRQRTGLGKRLFEHMLQAEGIEPVKMAIDRPSEKFLGFLNKHYTLSNPVKQMNNYVVFDEFFPSSPEKNSAVELSHSVSTPGKKQSANGLQTSSFTSPLGRYGAPRPPCSMGQIIHNQTSTISKNAEPTGLESVKSAPETNYQTNQIGSPVLPNPVQSAPDVYCRQVSDRLNGMGSNPAKYYQQQQSNNMWQSINGGSGDQAQFKDSNTENSHKQHGENQSDKNKNQELVQNANVENNQNYAQTQSYPVQYTTPMTHNYQIPNAAANLYVPQPINSQGIMQNMAHQQLNMGPYAPQMQNIAQCPQNIVPQTLQMNEVSGNVAALNQNVQNTAPLVQNYNTPPLTQNMPLVQNVAPPQTRSTTSQIHNLAPAQNMVSQIQNVPPQLPNIPSQTQAYQQNQSLVQPSPSIMYNPQNMVSQTQFQNALPQTQNMAPSLQNIQPTQNLVQQTPSMIYQTQIPQTQSVELQVQNAIPLQNTMSYTQPTYAVAQAGYNNVTSVPNMPQSATYNTQYQEQVPNVAPVYSQSAMASLPPNNQVQDNLMYTTPPQYVQQYPSATNQQYNLNQNPQENTMLQNNVSGQPQNSSKLPQQTDAKNLIDAGENKERYASFYNKPTGPEVTPQRSQSVRFKSVSKSGHVMSEDAEGASRAKQDVNVQQIPGGRGDASEAENESLTMGYGYPPQISDPETQVMEEQVSSSPKLARPRSLSIQLSEEQTEDKHKDDVESEVQNKEVVIAEEMLENMTIENSANVDRTDGKISASEDKTPTKRTPSHLTDQGFFDLKFYHNKLW